MYFQVMNAYTEAQDLKSKQKHKLIVYSVFTTDTWVSQESSTEFDPQQTANFNQPSSSEIVKPM